ncbi:5-methylcytosine restriction system specificity protein McrC [Mesobacillus foraminis]|uniref:5-methylcytosine-specific restriction endonuclease McrBC regulatory subunit McrC n=1 Tax=Mesobacillus foraminis TaxID=279826 RepID=A0A4R2B365_9BACI|nr:hypothetical protein [Mesobacillus foraminis]TCN21077.1 5-methylcytosine-specific restriction endonuclease McrBC regulatory subunit McrC [Mesobacillus foraminis]
MSKETILLEEYGKDPFIITLSSEDEASNVYNEFIDLSAAWKKKLNLSFAPFEVVKTECILYLYAKGITGFIKMNNLHIEVVPKFLIGKEKTSDWRVALTRALILLNQEKFFDNKFTSSKQSEAFLPDLMAETFLFSLEQGINIGLPRSYKETRERIPYYRGSYDSTQFINHLLKPHLIPCKYDEYTTENIINQILKSAAIELSKTVYSSKLAIRLSDLGNSIDASYQIPSIVQIENTFLPPQYSYLSGALDLSKLILQNKSLEHNTGELELRGFLWDSAKIFENLVKLIIRTYCLRSKKYQYSDKPITLMQLASREVPTRAINKIDTSPDIRILQKECTKFLLDAKYKIWSRQPKNNDVYQVMAGSRVTHCKLASLVYPLPQNGNEDTLIYNIEGDGFPKVVSVIFVDITKLALANGLNTLVKKFSDDLDTLHFCG